MPKELICKGLTKKYAGTPTALDHVSFSIPSSKGIFTLIGRNGAGKTTLTRILATELAPTSGTASINGLDILKDTAELRERMAILPQEARAVAWLTPKQTIFSYLLYRGVGRAEALEKADAMLERLGMKKYANTLNRLLSGGMKRKTLIATILASDAEVLFVDEPTTGLDPVSRAELWDVLKEFKKDHFIFLTTHYLEEAEMLADKLCILEQGRMMAMGSIESLRETMGYQYSVSILERNVSVRIREGKSVTGYDGRKQIFTTRDEANRLAAELIAKGRKFSINPVSLDDIFFYLVKKPISEDSGDEDEGYGY